MEKQLETLIIMLGLQIVMQSLVAFLGRDRSGIDRRLSKLEHDMYDRDGEVRDNRHQIRNMINELQWKLRKIINGDAVKEKEEKEE